MSYRTGSQSFSLPPLEPAVRNILIGAVGLYIIELIVQSTQPGLIDALIWHRLGTGFEWYQPATRYLVQNTQPLSFLLALLVLYFFLPTIYRRFNRQQWIQILGAALFGSAVLGLALDGVGLLRAVSPLNPSGGTAAGWSTLCTALIAIFGLINPNAVVNLFFVLPVRASLFTWGSGVVALLYFLYSPQLGTAEHLGTWLSVIGWWFLIGPGSRTRKLKAKSRKIERDLQRFNVLDGGRSEDKNRDDWVN